MATFKTLRKANEARQKEWDPEGKLQTFNWRYNELVGEVGELCNAVKKLERARLGLPGSRTSKGDLADEMADVVICADLYLMTQGMRDFPLVEAPVDGRTLPEYAAVLVRGLNLLFDYDSAESLIFSVELMAATAGVDLRKAVAVKFNATSDKVGLKTRLEL